MSHHIVPVKTYIQTFAALVFLTVITVAVSYVDFGAFEMAVALIIALAKASLVAMIFMGLKWDKGFNVVILLTSVVFMIIFFLLTLGDFQTRKSTDPLEAERFGIESPVKKISKQDASHHSDASHH